MFLQGPYFSKEGALGLPKAKSWWEHWRRFARRNVCDSVTEISILMMQNLSRIWSEAPIGRRSSFIVLAIVYEWQTKDKRPQRSNGISRTKQSIFAEYSLPQKKHLSFSGVHSQMNTTLYQNRPGQTKNWTNLHLEHHHYRIYYVNTDLCHQYGISVTESQTFLFVKRPSAAMSKEKRLPFAG